MNVLAINGSPKGADGNTDILVQAFLSGVRAEDGETETVYLNQQSIAYCQGCFSCWTATPGVCIHDDDMSEMLKKMRLADVVVFASPLYGNMLTGQMKTFIDRTLPLSNPAIEQIGGEYVHPPRYEDGVFRVGLICNAGFPETHHFAGLKKTFELSTSGPRSELVTMICCAAGPTLSIPGAEEHIKWYLDATIQAGREVASEGRVSLETQAILDRSLAEEPGAYAGTVNAYWDRVSQSSQTANAGSASKHSTANPSSGIASAGELIARLPRAFSPAAAAELDVVIQFDISDETPGEYYLAIADGQCTAHNGAHPAPTMTVQSPAQVWIDVCTGKLDGAGAYMTGKYRVTGDMKLLMKFGSLFRNRR